LQLVLDASIKQYRYRYQIVIAEGGCLICTVRA